MIAMKIIMSVGTSIWSFGHSTEAIQVQLPLETGQFGMTEITRKHV